MKPLPEKALGPVQAQPKEEEVESLLVQAKRSQKRSQLEPKEED